MNAISIGYRFSRPELSTLLQALRVGPLPGAPLEPVDDDTAQRVLQQLSDKELALIAGDTIYVDKLTDFLLRGAAQPTAAVAATDNRYTVVLWDVGPLYILGDFPEHGECTLTPLENREGALAALTDALCRMARPLWFANVFNPDDQAQILEGSPISEHEVAASALELMDRGREGT